MGRVNFNIVSMKVLKRKKQLREEEYAGGEGGGSTKRDGGMRWLKGMMTFRAII